MPAYHLPIFPAGTTLINEALCFQCRDGTITYFNYMTPVFSHSEDDKKSFRMITSQFCTLGACSASGIIKTFGVNKQTVYRDKELYKKEGAAGFFKKPKRGGPTVITPEVRVDAEKLLIEGMSVQDVAEELAIPYETLKKAIQRGRVLHIKKKSEQPVKKKL